MPEASIYSKKNIPVDRGHLWVVFSDASKNEIAASADFSYLASNDGSAFASNHRTGAASLHISIRGEYELTLKIGNCRYKSDAMKKARILVNTVFIPSVEKVFLFKYSKLITIK